MDNYNKLKLDATYRVTLHKNLIEADFTKSLTLTEQRLLYAAISNIPAPIFKTENGKFVLDENGKKIIEKPITELPKFKMSVKDFSEMLGWKEIDYKKLKKVTGELMSKVITAKAIENDDAEQFQWVAYTRYIKGTGTVLIELHPRLLPFVANLTENFASVSLGEITNFKSKYSARLFLLLKQWAKLGEKRMELDEIRRIIGVGFTEKDGKRVYKLGHSHHLRQRALTPAIEEINKFTDLDVHYVEEIESQKVVAVTFHIKKKKAKPDTKKPSTPKAKPEPKPEPQPDTKKPSVYDEIAQTIPDLEKSAYPNIAKHLKGIANIEAIKGRVIVELNKLASYIDENPSIKKREGFAIKEVERAVLNFKTTNDFNFDELLKGSKPQRRPQGRTELVPDWFNNRNEEQTPVIPQDQTDFEAEKAKILAKLQAKAE